MTHPKPSSEQSRLTVEDLNAKGINMPCFLPGGSMPIAKFDGKTITRITKTGKAVAK